MVNKKCLICNKTFSVKNYRENTAKFCSRKCNVIYQGKQRKVDKVRRCVKCGKFFCYTYKAQKFCSYECYWESMRECNKETCQQCKKQFEVYKSQKAKFCSKQCQSSFYSGKNHPRWKNGCIDSQGYKQICINSKTITEHRYFVEQKIGRKLSKDEHVHHINGNKTDNRLENLYLFSTNSDHIKYHNSKNKIKLESNII